MEQMADDLNALLDDLEVREKIIFCGLSMGGYIGWQFWQRHRHRVLAMIMCDTRGLADTPEAAEGRRKLAALTLQNGSAEAAKVMLAQAVRTSNMGEAARIGRVCAADDGTKSAGRRSRGCAGIGGPARLARDSENHRRAVAGHRWRARCISPVAEMREIADTIPDAAWVVVPHVGHMSTMEDPTVVNQAIAEFITL